MEPSLQSGSTSNNFEGNSSFEKQKPKGARNNKVVTFMKRFWYIFVIIGVLVGLGVAIVANNAREASAWQRATDAFGRADYETAKKEIGGFGVPSDEAKLKIYAQTMLATRTLDKALDGYTKLYDKTKDPASLLIIGNIYNQQENYDKAIATYKDVIAKNANTIQAYVNLATVYKLRSDADKAKATAQDAVDKNQKSTVAHELLVSMLLDEKGSAAYKKAVADLKALNPQDPLLKAINEI